MRKTADQFATQEEYGEWCLSVAPSDDVIAEKLWARMQTDIRFRAAVLREVVSGMCPPEKAEYADVDGMD